MRRYYIIVVLVLGAVISGIIIDAFSEDRLERTQVRCTRVAKSSAVCPMPCMA